MGSDPDRFWLAAATEYLSGTGFQMFLLFIVHGYFVGLLRHNVDRHCAAIPECAMFFCAV